MRTLTLWVDLTPYTLGKISLVTRMQRSEPMDYHKLPFTLVCLYSYGGNLDFIFEVPKFEPLACNFGFSEYVNAFKYLIITKKIGFVGSGLRVF